MTNADRLDELADRLDRDHCKPIPDADQSFRDSEVISITALRAGAAALRELEKLPLLQQFDAYSWSCDDGACAFHTAAEALESAVLRQLPTQPEVKP